MNANKRIERLIKAGVTSDQIEKARDDFPQRQPDLDLTKFEVVEPSGQTLIPLSEVKYAINRVDEGLSWLDNFTKNNEYRQGENGSFEKLLTSLEKRGLHDFIDSFQVDQDVAITASYYEDFNTYVIGEGKHRATFAKVIGMEKIKAEVTTYKSNPNEKRKFLDYQNKRKKLEKSIKSINLEFNCEKARFGLDKGENINIKFGQKSIVKLAVIDSYYLGNEKMEMNIQIINEVSKFIKKVKGLPFLRSFIANLFFNNGNYHPLTCKILEKLIRYGYFKIK